MEKNELKKVSIKNSLPYYFDDSIKVEDFPFDNILLDKNHIKIFWFMAFHRKLLFKTIVY